MKVLYKKNHCRVCLANVRERPFSNSRPTVPRSNFLINVNGTWLIRKLETECTMMVSRERPLKPVCTLRSFGWKIPCRTTVNWWVLSLVLGCCMLLRPYSILRCSSFPWPVGYLRVREVFRNIPSVPSSSVHIKFIWKFVYNRLAGRANIWKITGTMRTCFTRKS